MSPETFLRTRFLRPLAKPSLPLVALAIAIIPPVASADFVNFETPQVHPVALSPDANLLAVCNTADNRVEFFDLNAGDAPVPTGSVPVGLDPVSVRFRTEGEAWVVNQLSDTVSIVDVAARTVKATIATDDEPADVVFAGVPLRAYVSCSQADVVMVFDPVHPTAPPTVIPIEGEDPRALAVSPDGATVYAAVFESGNGSTVLGGGADTEDDTIAFPPNVVNDPRGPYGGTNPPPNDGAGFEPPRNTGAGTPPGVALIVKQDAEGAWRDDNGADWTALVSGPQAAASGRPVGWELVDNDVAVIDTATGNVSYIERLMNICMALAVNPSSGHVSVIGTDAINEVRFEPVVNGIFVRVLAASVDPAAPGEPAITDLNPHLDYSSHTAPQETRDRSLGDPRGIAWTADGTRAFVTGMGSNNVIVIDGTNDRAGANPTIEVGEGPTGVVVDDGRGKVYVLNRFGASLSVIDVATETESTRLPIFDPTPEAIKVGRKHLYDTHRTSGLGQVSCASCHIDARTDRLGWDLGDPSGELKRVLNSTHNLGGGVPGLSTGFDDFHPMKGPMTTQTMQDIIGKEPHHWRGDRDGLEEFNHAFMGLLGDDVLLTDDEMQEFEDFLATVCFPPNPFRNLDNSLPTDLPLAGHYTTGRFLPAGRPLPNGNAQRALDGIYRPLGRAIDRGVFACATCHTLPTGAGTDTRLNLGMGGFVPINPGPNGERHLALVAIDGSTQRNIKIAQLRNLYDKVGFEMTQTKSRAGFGYLHDGSIDSLSRFLSEPAFEVENDQEVADLVALMLAFSGSGFGEPTEALQPPGPASKDAHAAVGQQLTRTGNDRGPDDVFMNRLLDLARAGAVDLVARANVGGVVRGWTHAGGTIFQADAAGVAEELADMLARASTESPLTFTAVPTGCGVRIGIERDRDGILDHDETRDLVPAIPGIQNPFRPDETDSTGDNGSLEPDGVPDGDNDFDGDGDPNGAEFAAGTNPVDNLAVAGVPLDVGIAWNETETAILLSWDAAADGEYEILYSSDFVVWKTAGGGNVTAGPGGGRLQWTDAGVPETDTPPAEVERRFYIVNRVR